MSYKSFSDEKLPPWQAQESFSLVDFLAEAPDYFAREPFTIHIHPRSEGIHEFLNLQIQLKVARLSRLKDQILTQIKAYKLTAENSLSRPQKSRPSTQVNSPKTAQPGNLSAGEEGNLLYQKGELVFKIVVSPEQRDTYFEALPSSTPDVSSSESKATPRKRDIFDRFLQEPDFFKRSNNPEMIPPDESIEASVTEDADLVTETLAKIHMAQGNHAEAQRIYHKLGLLFPEKSGYFEAQIEKLQDLDTKNDA